MAQVPDIDVTTTSIGGSAYTVPFAYQNRAEVFVEVNGVPVAFTWVNDGNISITPAPAAGAIVRRYRSTSALQIRHDYRNGVPFTPNNIAQNNDQLLFVVQEATASADAALTVANSVISAAQAAAEDAAGAEAAAAGAAATAAEVLSQTSQAVATANAAAALIDDALQDSALYLRNDLANSTDPAKGAGMVGRAAQVVSSISELRQLLKTTPSNYAVVKGYSAGLVGGGLYALDEGDTTSPEDLSKGVIVANDGGRWFLTKPTGAAPNATVGKDGTLFNDYGYALGYMSGANVAGNGNKFNYYQLRVDGDQVAQRPGVNGATGPKVNGLHVSHNFGGPAAHGGRHAIEGTLLQGFGGAGATAATNTDRNYVGVQGQVLSDSGDGGSAGDLRGAYFGMSAYAGIRAGAKYVRNVTAAELNTEIQAGTGLDRVHYHSGMQIASIIGERGTKIDAALSISNLGDSALGWRHGMYFGSQNGAHAFINDSTLIKVDPVGLASSNMLLAFDFQGVNFTNAILRAPYTTLFDGSLDLSRSGSALRLGDRLVSSTPFTSYRSGGLNAAYDSRLIAIGGTASNGGGVLQVDAAEFVVGSHRPSVDATNNIGSALFRYGTVYAATGTINTSDAREKTPVEPLTKAELQAAAEMSKEIGTYQWLSSLESKGKDARTHVGMTVQRAIEIMRRHGLDPFKYGFICYDSWTGSDELTSGDEVLQHSTEAGDRYGFRYDQLNIFIAAGLNYRLTLLEA